MSEHHTERLFFALWPNKVVLSELKQLSQSITQGIVGKVVSLENLHITLAFIGNVDVTIKPCLQQAAATVQIQPFNLILDQIGYWPKTHILWLSTHHIPELLLHLVTQLTTALQDCGYHAQQRPFQPHVTLMRKASRFETVPIINPIRWSVQDFCLVRSTTLAKGAHYEILTRWDLS